mgnify:CR=1 FL=1
MDLWYHISNNLKDLAMGRIVANVRIGNLLEPGRAIECDALVDTGVAYLVLPKAWQNYKEKHL